MDIFSYRRDAPKTHSKTTENVNWTMVPEMCVGDLYKSVFSRPRHSNQRCPYYCRREIVKNKKYLLA